jgi:hypothetical protein
LWDLSNVVGQLSIGLMAVLCTLVAVQYFPALKESAAPYVPAPFRHFFEKRDTPVGVETTSEHPIMEGMRLRIRPEPKAPGQHHKRFGMGSTKDEVLSIQGDPASRTQDTWKYGESEVFFSADRVIGWRNSAVQPLRVR